MDDKTFQSWSEALSSLREKRKQTLNNFHQQRGAKYTIKDFGDVGMASLEEVVAKWWEFELASVESKESTDDAGIATEEMGSIVDFELEAITRDLESFEGGAAWDEKSIQEEMESIQTFADETKRSYALKIRSALGPSKAAEPASEARSVPPETASRAPTPPPAQLMPPVQTKTRTSGSRSSGTGSGVALFFMFILGLLLGSGPSFYFWDLSQKSQSSNQEAVARLTSEKRALEDNLSVYQQHLSQLATGKIKTLPQLEAEMAPIRENIAARKKKIEHDFATKKESILRRTPAGDLQDRAIKTLERNRDEGLSALDSEEKSRLEPYLKDAQLLKELTEK